MIIGNLGGNLLAGGGGNDTFMGGGGNDTIDAGAGNDRSSYLAVTDVLDTATNGHDTINNFDANATGGQDFIDLTALFNALGTAFDTNAERVAAVQWNVVNATTAQLQLNLDGQAGFEYTIATVNLTSSTTADLDKTTDVVLGGT